MNVFVPQSQIHKPTNSLTNPALISFKIKVIELSLWNKNISMSNMFTFDVFSVCHSLCQSVTGIALFILCFHLWNVTFHKISIKLRILSLFFLQISFILYLSVCLICQLLWSYGQFVLVLFGFELSTIIII